MIVVDTDVTIDFLRGEEEAEKLISKIRDEMAITSITLSELYYGACKSTKVEKHTKDIRKLLRFVRVLQTDLRSAKVFGEKKASLEEEGEKIDDLDLLIASIVISNGASLVTRNISHFEKTEIEVKKPKQLLKEIR